MRKILTLLLGVICMIILLALYGILNTSVSIKYEIDDSFMLKKNDPELLEKASLYHNTIIYLWVVIGICIIAFILITRKLNKQLKRSNNGRDAL